jgi:hypothetical protein
MNAAGNIRIDLTGEPGTVAPLAIFLLPHPVQAGQSQGFRGSTVDEWVPVLHQQDPRIAVCENGRDRVLGITEYEARIAEWPTTSAAAGAARHAIETERQRRAQILRPLRRAQSRHGHKLAGAGCAGRSAALPRARGRH